MRRPFLGLLLVMALACGQTPDAPAPAPVPEGCPAQIGTQVELEGAAQHLAEGTPIAYKNNPPSSGDHWANWLPYGKYRTEQKRERWVHSLEHGAVVLLYNCPSGCDDVRDALEKLFDETPADETSEVRVIVTPDSKMPKQIAAVSWGFLLEQDALDADALKCFVGRHKGHAPENL